MGGRITLHPRQHNLDEYDRTAIFRSVTCSSLEYYIEISANANFSAFEIGADYAESEMREKMCGDRI